MGRITFEMAHRLGKDEAKQRIEALTQYWGRKYGVATNWNGDSVDFKGKVMGVSLDGTLRILDDKVSGDATDPGMLLRGQAKKYVERKFATYLDPGKTLPEIQKAED